MFDPYELAARADRLVAQAFERSLPVRLPDPALRPISDNSVRRAKTPQPTIFVCPQARACKRWAPK